MKSFKDKVAVITGAASGIGQGTAIALAARGAHVVVADTNEMRGKETVRKIESIGTRAIFQQCDVTQEKDVDRIRELSLKEFGKINILMNNVGILPAGNFEDVPLSEWERTLQVNLLSYVRCTQKVLPDIIASGDGHIVNTASLAALLSYDTNLLAYAASKAAVASLSEGLALYLAPKNIGVTCLCPAPVSTNISEHTSIYGQPTALGIYAVENLKTRTPEEVGEMIAQAILENKFLLHTSEEIHETLVKRTNDPESYIASMSKFIWQRTS